jgi:hypothetical protein
MFGESSPIHYTFVATPAPLWMVPTKVRILKTGVADWCTATTVPEPVDVPNLMSQDRAEVIRIILLESGTGVNLPRSFPKAAIVKGDCKRSDAASPFRPIRCTANPYSFRRTKECY